jgi:hypothetical protein
MKYWIIILFLFRINSSFAAGDSLNLSLAMIEKSIFESGNDQQVNDLLYKKSDIYFQNELPGLSVKTLRRIDTSGFSKNDLNVYFLKIAYSFTMDKKFDHAFDELENIYDETDDIHSEKIFLQSFVINEMEQYSEVKKLILSDSVTYKCLDSSMNNLQENIELKNPDKAFHLSGYFPGAGQAYAGNFWQGLLSFTLTAGSAAFGVYNIANDFYVMGIVSGLYPGLKFYSGGKKLAENLAEEENTKKKEQLKTGYRKMLYRFYDCNQKIYPMRIDGIK